MTDLERRAMEIRHTRVIRELPKIWRQPEDGYVALRLVVAPPRAVLEESLDEARRHAPRARRRAIPAQRRPPSLLST